MPDKSFMPVILNNGADQPTEIVGTCGSLLGLGGDSSSVRLNRWATQPFWVGDQKPATEPELEMRTFRFIPVTITTADRRRVEYVGVIVDSVEQAREWLPDFKPCAPERVERGLERQTAKAKDVESYRRRMETEAEWREVDAKLRQKFLKEQRFIEGQRQIANNRIGTLREQQEQAMESLRWRIEDSADFTFAALPADPAMGGVVKVNFDESETAFSLRPNGKADYQQFKEFGDKRTGKPPSKRGRPRNELQRKPLRRDVEF